ncbi:MAG: T9SS type A sorting domain-containing protein [Bacteroidetes bacterium]|nr:T9SS type A sorting domain-containing protein [Bacteroidota bacterium]
MKQLALFSCLVFLHLCGYAQTPFTIWNFNNLTALPSTGSGTLTNIGGTTFTYASGAVSGGSSDTAVVNNAYNTTGYAPQNTAPKTAGVQVAVSTVGFQNIQFRFDQRLSNTACNTYVVQYTTDITAPVPVWIDAQVFTFTPAPSGTGDVWYNLRNTDLSAITALDDNPNVGFRIVSDYDPIAGTYLAARSTSSYSPSGTSRFDMITVSGESLIPPVPFQLQFIGNDKTVNEQTGTTNVYAIIDVAGNASASVDVNVSSFSNASSGSDYTIGNVTLSIPANAQAGDTLTLPITIMDDLNIESDEYIILKFSNAVNANYQANDQYVVYIKDNDKILPVASNKLALTLVNSFSNGVAGTNSAEIVAYDSISQRLYIANSIGAKLNIVSFENPANPVMLYSISISAYGNINSVAVKNGLVALAIENTSPQQNGYVVFLDSNGNFLHQVNAGAMPDMITFNHAGTKVYTANEGEPNTAYTVDPEGTITVVDLSLGVLNATSSQINFNALNGQEVALRAQGIRIFGPGASVSQDMEPEYITIADDDSKAWVSLQENNAMAEINLNTNTITAVYPLGFKNYNQAENSFDASNTTLGINLAQYPVKGMYLPDAIAQFTTGGNTYIFSANEGDAREYAGFSEIKRVNAANYLLDNTIFPQATEMKNNSLLGRLNITSTLGDTDNDGDFDEIYTFGARSFSVWQANAGLSQVYDSKNELELITENHPIYGSMFNASNGVGITVKDRSDDKGPEPEGIAIGTINTTPYVFIALERIGGVMAYDISNPIAPQYVTYQNNRGPDLGSEGIVFINNLQSPDGNNYVILANEISSTLSIYKVEENCAGTPTAGLPGFLSDTVCLGSSDSLWVNIPFQTKGVHYQWQQNTGLGWSNVAPGNGDTTLQYVTDLLFVNTQFRLIATCTNSNEQDTTDIINIVLNPLPVPAITASANNVCAHSLITLTASGADTYLWSGGITNAIPFSIAVTTVYTVTATDVNGCNADETYTVTVNNAADDISLASAFNAQSNSGNVSDNQHQLQNTLLNYYTGNCNLIASIDENVADMGNTLVTVQVENSVPTHNNQPYVKRWFQVSADTNSAARVYFYFTQDDFNTYNAYATLNNWPLLPINELDAAGIVNIRFTKNDDAGLGSNPLVIIPDSISYNASALYWVIGINTPSFSQFRLHAANAGGTPLPLTWLAFTAKATASGHELYWETANEINVRNFAIQQSANGVDFNTLGWKETDASHQYTFSNQALINGQNFYRIAQYDMDGHINYSKTILINHSSHTDEVMLYPNPANDFVKLSFVSSNETPANVDIYDITGRKVLSMRLVTKIGTNLTSISLQTLPKGMYTLNLNRNNEADQVIKLIKK